MPASSPAVGEVLGGTPTGTTGSDGVATFTLAHAPTDPTRVEITSDGLRRASGVHYTVSGQNVTFIAPFIPLSGAVLLADYPWADSAPTGGDLTTLAKVKLLLKETGSSADTLLSL